MGYRGKVVEQGRARERRAQGWTYDEISAELGVSKSSVSLWCRDVEIPAELRRARRLPARTGPNRLQRAKAEQIVRLQAEAAAAVGALSERDLFIAGIALYAGEGFKTGGAAGFANNDPRMVLAFVTWLRAFFEIDESRLRLRLYLHEGLDLDAASRFWSELTGIPLDQFGAPYRAANDPTRRRSKHLMGCPSIRYSCVRTHRMILGLTDALLHSLAPSGVAQPAERRPVKP